MAEHNYICVNSLYSIVVLRCVWVMSICRVCGYFQCGYGAINQCVCVCVRSMCNRLTMTRSAACTHDVLNEIEKQIANQMQNWQKPRKYCRNHFWCSWKCRTIYSFTMTWMLNANRFDWWYYNVVAYTTATNTGYARSEIHFGLEQKSALFCTHVAGATNEWVNRWISTARPPCCGENSSSIDRRAINQNVKPASMVVSYIWMCTVDAVRYAVMISGNGSRTSQSTHKLELFYCHDYTLRLWYVFACIPDCTLHTLQITSESFVCSLHVLYSAVAVYCHSIFVQ